jgi:hypothetical protein
MEDHLQFIFERLTELDDIGESLESSMAVSVILASLSSEYDSLITALEAWSSTQLTLNAVRSKLLEEWRRKKRVIECEPSGENALRVFDRLGEKTSGKSRPFCTYCKKRGHTEEQCRLKISNS